MDDVSFIPVNVEMKLDGILLYRVILKINRRDGRPNGATTEDLTDKQTNRRKILTKNLPVNEQFMYLKWLIT